MRGDTATRVLVTGGTGQIGSHLVDALCAQGQKVRCLVRDVNRLGVLASTQVELVQGDVTHPESLAEAVRGVEVVYHAAGAISYWRRRANELYRVNADGTRHLLDAAVAAGVRKFILTSSIATLGYVEGAGSGDESTAFNWTGTPIAYFESKRLAEQLVLAEQRLIGVAVNPGIVFGARDLNQNAGRLLQLVHRANVLRVPPGRTTVCNVDDVVAGHLLAGEHGRAGERYVLGGTMLSFSELYQRIATALDTSVRMRVLPGWLLLAAARLAELSLGQWREPALTVSLAQIVIRNRSYRSTKAESQLGYRPGPIEPGLAAAVNWYRGRGLLA